MKPVGSPRIKLSTSASRPVGVTAVTAAACGSSPIYRQTRSPGFNSPAGRKPPPTSPTGWDAFFCPDPAATVADVPGCVADRFSLETTFRDCKEVVGAGQQQVRFVWASVGAFHVCFWTFTMTGAWTLGRAEEGLVTHRSSSPWDDERDVHPGRLRRLVEPGRIAVGRDGHRRGDRVVRRPRRGVPSFPAELVGTTPHIGESCSGVRPPGHTLWRNRPRPTPEPARAQNRLRVRGRRGQSGRR